ncbi:MAG TPA: dihydroorotate dehydrogenase electron transfer subunit [Desulfobacteria bacterium]|nr:dihydroorotate dehydrogenase electron transfer subunit [Desulfobacteria bacterium]
MGRLLKATVLANDQVLSGIYKLVLAQEWLAGEAKPGQFLNIRVSGASAPLLRRPLSIHYATGNQVEVLFQVVGEGTKLLSQVKPGEVLDVQGPLGNGFELNGKGPAILVGGGMGIAPLVFLAARLREPICLLGSRNGQLLSSSGGARLQEMGLELQIATDDGSLGRKGLVTELLEQTIDKAGRIYTCGPKVMLREVARLAIEHNIPCQVSLEEHMACGVGACLGCVCQTKTVQGDKRHSRVCTDGPVFEAREVVWE